MGKENKFKILYKDSEYVHTAPNIHVYDYSFVSM